MMESLLGKSLLSCMELDVVPGVPPDDDVVEALERNRNATTLRGGLTPMHIAAMTNNIAAAEILIQTGKCQLSEKDRGGATPLHHAALLGHRDFIEFLVEHGADESLTDNSGATYKDLLSLCHGKKSSPTQSLFVQTSLGQPQVYETLREKQHTSAVALHPIAWLEFWERCIPDHEPYVQEDSLMGLGDF